MARDDQEYMRHCLVLAGAALAKGEVPAGTVAVHEGRVLGEGVEATRTLHDPTAHAVVLGVRAACTAGRTRSLAGATLYTMVEPCICCGFAARSVGIAGLVMRDTTIEAWGTPPSIVQVLAAECTELPERCASRRRCLPPTG